MYHQMMGWLNNTGLVRMLKEDTVA
jgi:hypothetical protein